MMKKRKKSLARRIIKWIILLVALAILGAAAWFIGYPMLKASVTITYDSYTAVIGSISNSLSFSGSVSVVNNEYLTASSSGTVREIYVSDGENVIKGQKLMRLSNGETVKANFDGTINEILVETGDEVTANTQLCQVVDFANMKVTLRVDEYDISEVSVGQACTVTFTAIEKSFPATISHINRLSASSGSVAYYTATARVEVTEDVLPGMQVSVSIPKEEVQNAVILKMDALSFDASNQAYVFTADETGALTQVYVEIGVDNGNYVEIKSGLAEGDVAYVESEEEASAATGLSGLLSGLMGGNSFSGGSMPSMDRSNFGNMDFSGQSRGGNMGGGTRSGG